VGPDSSGIQALYSRILERTDVRSVRLLLNNGEAVLAIRTVAPSPGVTLLQDLRAMPGVTSVDAARQAGILLASDASIRLGLLVGLVLFFLGGLLSSRAGFGQLLSLFAEEIKLLRTSGVREPTIQGPIVALGLLIGLAASLLLIAVLSLSHLALVAHPQVVPSLATGILEPGRVRTACLLALPLGLFAGALAGALGAALAGSRNLEP